jgi:tetratricopeptide (TPR) repeat protein
MGELAKAKSAYEHAQQSDPSDLIALLDLAEVALQEGQYRRALELAQEVPPQHALWARSRTLLARAYLELGQADMATRVMNQLVDAEPRSAAAHYNLALILRDQGKIEDAVRHLRKAVALEPDSETARFELARLLGVRGELDEAIQIIEQLLASAPGYAPAYPQAATLFSQQARPDRAIEVLRRGHALFPDDPSIANHLAWLLATSAKAELRNGAEAVELAELANKLTGGKYSSVLDTLAAAYAEAGRFDEAVAAAKRASELARQAQDDGLASAIEARLDLYQKQRPYHQP